MANQMPEQLREHFANKAKHDGKHGDKEEKMEKRKAALVEAGFDAEDVDAALAAFDGLADEAFDSVVAMYGKKPKADKHGDKKGKRVTQRMLEAVFRRGVGAYHIKPQSVRPNVTGPDQWGLARVNAFLRAVRTGRFQSGKFDLDLLPRDHPLSSKK